MEHDSDPEEIDSQKGPSIADEMAAAAEQGDVQGVLNQVKGHFHPSVLMPDLLRNLDSALHAIRKDDPIHLINELFGSMLVFQGTLLLRAQFDVQHRFSKVGSPQEPTPEMIERVEYLQRSICETSTVFSRVKHSLTLSADPMKPVKPLIDRKLSIVERKSDVRRASNA